MTSSRLRVLELLADGQFHSGEELAHILGVSRAAIWKQIRVLADKGIEAQAVRGRGYRLEESIELLDADHVLSLLDPAVGSAIGRFEVLTEVDSTNSHLMRREPPLAGTADVCLAEYQSSGRGRHGRVWHAPLGSGICLSIAWSFIEQPSELGALSLVLGVAVMRALDELGISGASLKWPNDILADGRKLGGILAELRGEVAGPAHIVAGVGLNVRMSQAARAAISDPWRDQIIDLSELDTSETPSRNGLAAALIEAIIAALRQFQQDGFAAFRREWSDHDAIGRSHVRIVAADGDVQGQALGVDEQGAMLVDVGGELRRFFCGEVSIRS